MEAGPQSELTQTLKILVTRYPGTMADLARKALIDRSTLYKIVSGQRTPREFQLEHLADALELSEEQKSALLLQYKQRGRGPDPRLRAELHHLLEVSFRVEDFTHREGLISNEAASQLRCSEQYIEGSRAVAAAVASLVANHILSGDTRPLLLSPFTNPMLDHVLVERFSAADGAPVTLSQLLIYAENRDIPREWMSGRVRPDPHTAVPFPAQAELRGPRRAPRHDRAQPRHADASICCCPRPPS